MNQSSLQDFSVRVLAGGRIGKRDVQILQRDLLVDGVSSREEAEILIRLDREAGSVHASWSAWFIGTLTDFVVWGARPTGRIDDETGRWLAAALAEGGRAPRTTRLIAELEREAQEIDAGLIALRDEPHEPETFAEAPCALAA
jgi:hypothetical protein